MTAEIVAEAGIKANIALAGTRFVDDSEDFDFDTDPGCKLLVRVVEKWHNYDNGRIKIDAGIHAEYTSNHQLWEAVSAYATEQKLGLQLQKVEQYDIDGAMHSVIVLKKVAPTPPAYPRRFAKIKQAPL